MARFLALVWDQPGCHLLAANVSGVTVEVEQATLWSPAEDLTPASAETLGGQLREFLKNSGIAPAPLLVCLGRERFIVKEMRYPPVAPQEEQALVRFQVSKELAENLDDLALDYAGMGQDSQGRKQALVVILRRPQVTALQALARAAGLKLLALTPRPFAMPALFGPGFQAAGAAGAVEGAPIAVLLGGNRSAELTVLRGNTVLVTRALAAGPQLAAELRRSLAMIATQGVTPGKLLVIGEAIDSQSLGSALNVPVAAIPGERFDVERRTGSVPAKPVQRAGIAAGLGLLHAWAERSLAINLAMHKEVVAASEPARRRKVLLGAGGLGLVLVSMIFGYYVLSGRQAEIRALEEERVALENRAKTQIQDKLDLAALKDWDEGDISWLDEFYDLAARLPQVIGLHLTRVQVEPLPRKGPKDVFAARMTIFGVVPDKKDYLVHQFLDALHDAHLQARLERFKGGASQEFTIKVDLARQSPGQYDTVLVPPAVTAQKAKTPAPAAMTGDDDDGGEP